MKNIYFIEARSPGAHIFSRTPFPRLGTVLLATILKNRGYNTKVFIEDIARIDWKLLEDADIICISSITSTAPRAYDIAKRFINKGIPIVIGGPHSTFMPEESLSCADYVIRGEGEETIVELIEHLESGLPLDNIKGLSLKTRQGGIRHNPGREFISDLDTAPVPDFSLVYNWKKAKVMPVATSRGCPFACKFCSVIPMFGRKYRFKSINKVIEEIKAVANMSPHVFFVDDNFAANKQRTKELLRAIADNNIDIEWSAQTRTDVAKDPELIQLMAETGCFGVFIGFESINPRTLALYNKHQGIDDINKCIKMLKKHSINIHGMFVLGSDTDDIQTIKNTHKYAEKLEIESVQFMMLTPLPGTPVFDELKEQGRIIHTDWSKYDAHHAVFEPKLMTAFELHVETLKAMAKFYSWKSIFLNIMGMNFFYGLIGFYGRKSVKKSISKGKRYLENLKDMVLNEFDRKTDRLRKYFLLKRNKTKNIVINAVSLEKSESIFFTVFFEKLGRKLIINKGKFDLNKNSLTITPFIRDLTSGYKRNKKYLLECYEKYKDKKDSIKIIKLDSISLYRACVNIGMLLNVRLKKIRNAYEKAIAEIGGNDFECNAILIMVVQDYQEGLFLPVE
ncbi:MAG: B12-binding domain-containing radical SAM protein [Candidatus Mariimomonas ferrooxydans]